MLFIIVAGTGSYYLYTSGIYYPVTELDAADSSETQPDIVIDNTPDEVIEEEPPFQRQIQVEVLNGCGVNGIAKIFQSILRDKGFDVANTDNYKEQGKEKWDVAESMVLDHTGNMEEAIRVAEVLGISVERIYSKDDPSAIYDISVVVGKDYRAMINLN